jgi:hypothetical protein
MYMLRKALVLCCCVGLLGACAPRPGEEESANLVEKVAEDLPDQPADPSIVVAAPTMARTVFSNEWVGVADVDLEPGELIPPHSAGVRYVYPQVECTLGIVAGDNEKEIANLTPEELTTWPAGQLSIANEGESAARFLVVERNPIETAPDLETLPAPDVAVDMERHGTLLLDDDNVVAAEISLDQTEVNPLPPNLPLLVIAISDCNLELTGPTVGDSESIIEAGHAIWQPAGCESVSNVGDARADFLVLGFRK